MGRKRKIVIRLVSLADQICFSVANFILTVILARYFSEVEFAGYVIGLSIALTVQGVQRNCYVVQNAVLAPEILRGRVGKVLGQQSVAWMILIAVESMLAAGVFIISPDPYLHSIAISTIICTLIYTQLEFDRIIFVKHDKYFHPFLASLGFFVLIGVLFFAIPHFQISYWVVMVLIGLYTILKMFWLFASVGRPDLFWGWRLLARDFRRYFASSVMGVLGYSGHNHVPVFVLGAFAPPLQAAVFGAMRGLMQPLQIIVRSFDIIDKNFFQSRMKSDGGMRGVLIRQLLVYSAFSGLVVLGALLFGEWVIYFAYGEKYVAYSSILVGWAIIFFFLAITLPLETAIVKLDKLNAYNYYRLPSGLVGTVLSFLLWEDYGVMGAVIACLAGWIVSIGFAFWIVWPVLRGEKKA